MPLTLKKVETELKNILTQLNQQLNQSGLPQAKRDQLLTDIAKVQVIVDGLPNSCHKTPAYDLGI